jgi:hypothetical protein
MKTALKFRVSLPPAVKPVAKPADPFLSQLNEALSQVDPRVCVEVRWLANLGLVVEAERLLIDYLVSDNRSYEIQAERESIAQAFRADNIIMCLWICRIVDINVWGTFAACMGWVCMAP